MILGWWMSGFLFSVCYFLFEMDWKDVYQENEMAAHQGARDCAQKLGTLRCEY